MSKIVFISDLHLNPEQPDITEKFVAFVDWALVHAETVYILGDFFHAWPGDDAIDAWSEGIAQHVRRLISKNISVYFMPGNRDFLLGKRFAKRAGWKQIPDPYLINLGEQKVLLAHGDAFCTSDIKHQRFRSLTRNAIFTVSFQLLPLSLRNYLVNQVRYKSQMDRSKTIEQMDVVQSTVIDAMTRFGVTQLIHGHTHKPGLSKYSEQNALLNRYVLSDWDDIPQYLCYDNTHRLYYDQVRVGRIENE